MARLPTARVAVLQFAYPVVAIGMDAAYFKEPLHARLLGVALMMGPWAWEKRQRSALTGAGACVGMCQQPVLAPRKIDGVTAESSATLIFHYIHFCN